MANNDKDKFLYPRSSYQGKIQPENLVFNANLQEFAHKISYICNLETGGKLPPDEAYKRINLSGKNSSAVKKS